ncbi:MAG TPA: complex I subunit 1 family protein, partial [Planctomycetaceae bacterium]|nr:complex I subunit 1 family protein [Planctomycetaceae bacterium]
PVMVEPGHVDRATLVASVKRAPFDLAEAESELVAGFHTEYSGIRWSFFFLAEYASMFAVSGIAVLLFLGGSATGLGLEPLLINPLRSWGQDFLVQGFSLGNYVANLIGATIFVVKAGVLVTVQIWVRWTLPRLRIDQVMTTCLKYLVPISCFLFLGAVLWPLLLASSTLGRPTFLPVGRTDAATKAKTAAVPNSDFEIRISNFPPVEEGRR